MKPWADGGKVCVCVWGGRVQRGCRALDLFVVQLRFTGVTPGQIHLAIYLSFSLLIFHSSLHPTLLHLSMLPSSFLSLPLLVLLPPVCELPAQCVVCWQPAGVFVALKGDHLTCLSSLWPLKKKKEKNSWTRSDTLIRNGQHAPDVRRRRPANYTVLWSRSY